MTQAICWVLIHSLWQGVLLALAGGGVVLLTKRSAAAVRYRLLCGLMVLFLAGLGLTFGYEWAAVAGGGDGGAGIGVSMNWLGEWCSAHAYEVVILWLLVAAGKSVRMVVGLHHIRRIRREGLAAPALWAERVEVLSRQLGIRRTVKLVESALVRVPVVIGQLKPIIYIPLGLVNHLPAGEMEAVVLHELAHIRRYDHVVNLVQLAAECMLFFNPGFLWISSILREERENCCDDVAIAHTLDRMEFVRALVRFKEHSMKGMALAFPGNKRQLLHRVLRIARQENKTLSGRERLLLLIGCIVVMGVFAVKVGRLDERKSVEVAMKVEERKAQGVGEVGVEGSAAPAVQPELMTVLQTRQQVTQNMQWVQAQLDKLHHKSNGRKKTGNNEELVRQQEEQVRQKEEEVRQREEEVRRNETQVRERDGQVGQNEDQVRQKEEEVRRNEEQVRKNEEQVRQNVAQAEKEQQAEREQQAEKLQQAEQAQRDREQAVRDREQAERDRRQAELDRQQAERDRQQAMRDREQADRDRAQAERERKQGETDRKREAMQRAESELQRMRQEAELQRIKGESDRRQAELNRIKELQDRIKAERDRQAVARDGQSGMQH